MEPGICEPTRGQKGDRTIEEAEKKEKRRGGEEKKAEEIARIYPRDGE